MLLERRRQGCRFAIELPPEVSGPAADATQQGVCLQLAVDVAFAPDNTGILAQEHMCLLWIPGAGVLVQTFQVPALPIWFAALAGSKGSEPELPALAACWALLLEKPKLKRDLRPAITA